MFRTKIGSTRTDGDLPPTIIAKKNALDLRKKELADIIQRQFSLEKIGEANITGLDNLQGIVTADTARHLACITVYEKINKKNSDGLHAVVGSEGAHYKPNAKNDCDNHICPGYEFAMDTFYEIFGGGQITAPSTLIKIANIPIIQVEGDPKYPEALKLYKTKLAEGYTPEQIFAEKPELQYQLKITNAHTQRLVQVGKTIIGHNPQILLMIQYEYEELRKYLGDEKLKKDLSYVLTGEYFREFIKVNPAFKTDISEDVLFDYLVNKLMLNRQSENRLKNFDYLDKNPSNEQERREREAQQSSQREQFNQLVRRHGKEIIIKLFALMRLWPGLGAGRKLGELGELPFYFEYLKTKLFLTETDEEIAEKIPMLFNELMDMENFSGIAAASLFTKPSDAKPDNAMCIIVRDNQKKVQKVQLIIIDGDRAAAQQFVAAKDEHYPGVKSVFYLFAAMHKPIPLAMRKELMEHVELKLLLWLAEIYEKNQTWQQLIDKKIIQEVDIVEPERKEAMIDYPIRFSPGFVTGIYTELIGAYKYLVTHKNATLFGLFNAVQPVLACYYKQISKQFPHPIEGIEQVFRNGKVSEILGEHLQNDLDEGGQPARTYKEFIDGFKLSAGAYEETRHQTVEETIIELLQRFDILELSPYSDTAISILKFVARKFPFVNKLPLKAQDLNQALLQSVKAEDVDLAYIKLLLNAGADCNFKDEAGRTLLHIILARVVPNTELLKLFLQQKNIKLYEADNDGYLPLFKLNLTHINLDKLNEENLLSILLKHEINLECRTKNEKNETFLDRCMRQNDVEAFIKLVHYGAGSQANAKDLLDFFQRNQSSMFAEQLLHAKNSLRAKNNEFHFLLALNSVVTNKNTGFPVRTLEFTVAGQQSYLNPAAAESLNQKQVVSDSQYGSHAIKAVTIDGNPLHFKFSPAGPLIHISSALFSHALFKKFFISRATLIKTNHNIPVLISPTSRGKPLQQVLENPTEFAEFEQKLPQDNFSALAVLHLILNACDGNTGNLIWDREAQTLTDIDMEQAMLPAVVKVNGKRKLTLLSILFCLKQAHKPITANIIEAILAINPQQLFETWLLRCITLEKQMYQLFNIDERNSLQNKKKILGIPFVTKMAIEMYERFVRLQNTLKQDPDQSILKIAKQVCPLPIIAYLEVCKENTSPAEAYRHISNDKQFSDVTADRAGTKVDHATRMQSVQVPDLNQLDKRILTPTEALEELRLALNEQADPRQVFQNVINGKSKPYLNENWQKCVSTFTFSQLNPEQMKLFCKQFLKGGLTNLNLAACKNISKAKLIKILKANPCLEILDLSGMNHFKTDEMHEILRAIQDNCPNLQKLMLNDLNNIQFLQSENSVKSDKPLQLTSLRSLSINGCASLSLIRLVAPQLESLETNNCQKLNKIELGNSLLKLKLLYCDNCPSIDRDNLESLVACSPELVRTLQVRPSQIITARLILMLAVFYKHTNMSQHMLNHICKNPQLALNGLAIESKGLIDFINRASMSFAQIDQLNVASNPAFSWELCKSLLLSAAKKLPTVVYTDFNSEPTKTTLITGANALMIADANNQAFIINYDGSLNRWNLVVNQKEASTFPHNKNAITAISALPNGDVLTGATDKLIKLSDKKTGQLIRQFKGHAGAITALLVIYDSNKGLILVSAGRDKKLMFWDINTGICFKRENTASVITSLQLAADNTFFATDEAGSLHKCAINSEEKKSIQAHQCVTLMTKVIDNDHVITVGADQKIKVWHWPSRACVQTLNSDAIQQNKGNIHNATITDVIVLKEQQLIATGSMDHKVKFWDLKTGICVKTIDFGLAPIKKLALAPGGNLLVLTDMQLHTLRFPSRTLELNKLREAIVKADTNMGEQKILLHMQSTLNMHEIDGVLKHLLFILNPELKVNTQIINHCLVLQITEQTTFEELAALIARILLQKQLIALPQSPKTDNVKLSTVGLVQSQANCSTPLRINDSSGRNSSEKRKSNDLTTEKLSPPIIRPPQKQQVSRIVANSSPNGSPRNNFLASARNSQAGDSSPLRNSADRPIPMPTLSPQIKHN